MHTERLSKHLRYDTNKYLESHEENITEEEEKPQVPKEVPKVNRKQQTPNLPSGIHAHT